MGATCTKGLRSRNGLIYDNSTSRMEVKLTTRMTRLNKAKNFLSRKCLADLEFLCSVSESNIESETRNAGDILASLGLTELFLAIWQKYSKIDFMNNDNALIKSVMSNVVDALCNFSENSYPLCSKIFESEIPVFIMNLLKSNYLEPSRTNEPRYEDVLDSLMAVLYNMLQIVPESRLFLREQKAVDVFQRYRESRSRYIKLLALILQGYVISEEENAIVNSDDTNFSLMKTLLESALSPGNDERREYGFQPREIISALNCLALYDENIPRIIKAGLLPFYVQLLQPDCSVEEQAAAAEGLWIMTFKCPQEVANQPGCPDALKDLANNNSGKAKYMAAGTLRNLKASERIQPSVEYFINTSQEEKNHVFISYQCDSKPMVMKLGNSLKEAGYKIWVDFDNMSATESALDEMAVAVEKAEAVIICLSQRYKEAPNCRSEGQYAYHLHKDILPIRIQPLYRPDGWLGILIGDKRVHDFSSQEKYEESLRSLIKDLADRGTSIHIQGIADYMNSDGGSSIATPILQYSSRDIPNYARWSEKVITAWLQDNELDNILDWSKGIDGNQLDRYKMMLQENPDKFSSMLMDSNVSYEDILKLSRALQQL